MRPDDLRRTDDTTLALRCVEGEKPAIAEFIRRHGPALDVAFDAARKEWGDLGISAEAFGSRAREAVCREKLRGSGRASFEDAIARLALSDLYLATGCALGLDAAWRRFDASFGSFLRAVVRALARAPRDTEEILAGLYSDLFFPRRRGGVERPSSLARFGGRASLRTWLRSILFTRVQDFYARQRRAPASLDHGGGEAGPGALIADDDRALLFRDLPEDAIARRDLARVVADALEDGVARLEPEERLAFHAHFVEEKTIEEVARLFGAHRATIGRRLKRARTKLVRTVESRLRIEFGAGGREIGAAIPDIAKEVPFDWRRALQERPRGRE